MTTEEEWRPVYMDQFAAAYEVSSLGRMRSLPRQINGKGGSTRWMAGKILKTPTEHYGYPMAIMSVDGFVRTQKVHLLVAHTFIPKPTDRGDVLQVNHKNADKTDNRVVNLEWVTPKENNQHAHDMGLCPRGVEVNTNKFTEDQIREIRRRAETESYEALGAEFDTHPLYIGRIRRRQVWAWLDPGEPRTATKKYKRRNQHMLKADRERAASLSAATENEITTAA